MKLEVKQNETLVYKNEKVVFKNCIGYKDIATVIKNNFQSFFEKVDDNEKFDPKISLLGMDWAKLINNIISILKEISFMTNSMIKIRQNFDIKSAMKHFTFDFSVKEDFDATLLKLVGDIELMLASTFANVENDCMSDSSYPSAEDYDTTKLETMCNSQYRGTLAHIESELEKCINGDMTKYPIFEFAF